MTALELTAAQRKIFKARAHPLHPLVIIGDAGLTAGVLKEIDHSLNAHELIKIRVVGDDREARLGMYSTICEKLAASPIQHIGKLLVVYRQNEAALAEPPRDTRRVAAKKVVRRNPISGRVIGPRAASIKKTRKETAEKRPPRTERVRKSGQKSAKKPFQSK